MIDHPRSDGPAGLGVRLAGRAVPRIGLGTWELGDSLRTRDAEAAAIRVGLDLGLRVIDTAEMYGNGASEELVGEAIAGRRDEVVLVSKVLPSNASRSGTVQACERSLRRLRTDHLDLYLLHWPGSQPLAETLAGFQDLQRAGKIRHWGVSNFDVGEMAELAALAGGPGVATDQVLYNLTRRGPELDLLPWCRERGLPVMAYSPVEQGRLLGHPVLAEIAGRHEVTPAQVALAWAIRGGGICAIPRTGSVAHVRENAAALHLALTPDDLADLDRAFPVPDRPVPLEML
ncbi:aldo/keto reductase [Nakamurella flavida]|uniref:Aldo/keto reductase n=1 Tax=Nakamurella flavida TaxID=363630 RepID=A0A938YFL6_9ACTN|nr:aldo/keto reductase [Nakamurella flavida]MBM9476781.1 aldo/keto reductase [Nakamurella flavida]MDP9778781.1 diketogulonate reductase-like aldo/keto reductase [Nakamurella flavida]